MLSPKNLPSITEGVISQCINNQGKTTILNYNNPPTSLAVSLLPPLYVPEVNGDGLNILKMDITNIELFLESKNLIIVEQTLSIDTEGIQGVWVKSKSNPPEILCGYIPLQPKTPKIKDVPVSHETIVPPILEAVDKNSGNGNKSTNLFKSFSTNEKIAFFLKECSLKTFAMKKGTITQDDFIEKSNYIYDLSDIGNGEIFKNKVFYDGDWIIVPDQETSRRLISYVKTAYLNDRNVFDLYLNKNHFDLSIMYSAPCDFIQRRDQYIFNGTDSILRWKSVYRKSEYDISFRPLPKVQNPYYYINIRIVKGALLLLQNNSSGSFFVALGIAYKLNSSKNEFGSNPGFYPPKDLYIPPNPSFDIYTNLGLMHRSDITPKISGGQRLKLFGYEDGTYAAIYVLKSKDTSCYR